MAAAYRNGDAQEPVRELVVLQRVLADEVNRGYDNLEPEIVKTVDGVRPRDLARALELAEGGAAPAGEHSEDLFGSCPVGTGLGRWTEQPVHFRGEIASSMVAARGNQREGVPRPREFVDPGHPKQTTQVNEILGSPHIVP